MKLPALAIVLATTLLLGSACKAAREKNMSQTLKTTEQQRWSQLFKMVDTNGDGKITREEFQAHYVPVTWLYFDKNGDGVLTPQEWAVDGLSQERKDWFRGLDENGDGVVGREEFERAASPEGVDYFFELMDESGDGVLSRKQLGIH